MYILIHVFFYIHYKVEKTTKQKLKISRNSYNIKKQRQGEEQLDKSLLVARELG